MHIRLTISIALLLALTKVSIAKYVIEQTHIIQKRDVTNTHTFVNEYTWWNLMCGEFSLLEFGYNYFRLFGPLSEEANTKIFLSMLKITYKKGLVQRESVLKSVLEQSIALYDIAAFNLSKKFADDGLEAAVLYVYTTKYIYRKLNEALRLESTSMSSIPRDMFLGPFALVLNAILIYSEKLRFTNELTYRGMNLSVSDLEMYREGTKFVWIDFTSSSVSESVATKYAGNVLFILNNSIVTMWRPKLIYNFSYNPADLEALYPSGAMFKVISVDSQNPKLTKIKAQLMNQCSIMWSCGFRKKRDTDDTCPWQPVGATTSSSHTASQGISLPKISYVACIFVYFILGSFSSLLT